MKKTCLLLLIIGMWLCPAFSFAQGDIVESTLKDGIGIRPLAMGGAFTAIADDINAVYYNPAGLYDLIFGYSQGNLDVNNDASDGSLYSMLNLGSLGYANWQRKGTGGEKVNVLALGFGFRGGHGFSWGVNYKSIDFDTGTDSSKYNWSADAGLIVRITPQLTLGIMAQDFAKDKKITSPSTGRFGIAYRPFDRWLLLAADAESGRTGREGLLTHLGAEMSFIQGLNLRVGSDKGKFTAGAGINLPFATVNYAVLSDKDLPTGSLHRFGFILAVAPIRERPFSIIKPKEYALIDIKGQLIGGKGGFSIFGGARTGADAILAQIKRATEDPAIDGIMLRISGFEGGFGSIGIVQELRAELLRAKKAGKKIVVYIESSAIGDEYYLASVADKIVAPSGASIGGIGRAINVGRVRELFNKIGIEWQIITAGEYKGTFNQFAEKMNEKQREMVATLVQDMYRQMVTDISESRGIEISKVKEIADGSIFTGRQAQELGLVDEIGYFKDASLIAGKVSGITGEAKMIPQDQLINVDERDYLVTIPYKIAVIEIDGDIVTGKSGENFIFGGRVVGADTITEHIRKAVDDFGIRAIILRVNSAGGSAVASGQIHKEIKRAREKGKIVVASFGDIAASGGYYVAASADKIVANPGTVTGSIGVVHYFPILEELFKKIGVESDVIKEGKHSDMFYGLRKLTTEEISSLQELANETYDEFIEVVVEGRGISKEVVAEIAQGKVYTGSQAKELNLVDELGGFSDAVDVAKDLANIPVEPRLVFYRERMGFLMEVGMETTKLLGLERLFEVPRYKLSEYRLPLD